MAEHPVARLFRESLEETRLGKNRKMSHWWRQEALHENKEAPPEPCTMSASKKKGSCHEEHPVARMFRESLVEEEALLGEGRLGKNRKKMSRWWRHEVLHKNEEVLPELRMISGSKKQLSAIGEELVHKERTQESASSVGAAYSDIATEEESPRQVGKLQLARSSQQPSQGDRGCRRSRRRNGISDLSQTSSLQVPEQELPHADAAMSFDELPEQRQTEGVWQAVEEAAGELLAAGLLWNVVCCQSPKLSCCR